MQAALGANVYRDPEEILQILLKTHDVQ